MKANDVKDMDQQQQAKIHKFQPYKMKPYLVQEKADTQKQKLDGK